MPAQTVTLSDAGFDISTLTEQGNSQFSPAPSNLNTNSGNPSYSFSNTNKSEISGLGFQQDTPTGLNVSILSQGRNSISNSAFQFGDGSDTLLIGGASSTGKYFMGGGNNTVTFMSRSTSDIVNVGSGSDTLVFGGNISNTIVQLTVDNSADTLRIASAATTTTGFRITGATDIDVLFIGTTQYNYTSSGYLPNEGAWVNTTDPNDKKFFN